MVEISSASIPIASVPRGAVPAAVARTSWIDIARGLGIILVVLGHAINGLVAAGMLAPDSFWSVAFFYIYTFHMPLFFVLAGLFIQDRISKDAAGLAANAWMRIAWPYALWSVIQLIVIDAAGAMVNAPAELSAWRLVQLIWEPTSQFWFLLALLVFQFASIAILPRWGAFALLGVAMIGRIVVDLPGVGAGWPIMAAQLARFALFFALGVCFGPALRKWFAAMAPLSAQAIGVASSAAWALAAAAAFASGQGYWGWAALPAALLGTLAVSAFAALPMGALGRSLEWLGRASMAIYLLHILFVAGARIVLGKLLGLQDPDAMLALVFLAGLIGPLIALTLAQRFRVARALGFV